ncbi:hypothetical protein KIP88_02600 [Bradyrhizobium sp. SRL28]|uniref:hypothetical protein n=1 Tax=Bradyrhizobium sp. SRL28 TaxID=2836178 RepID=UPI001BDDCCC9|nr:hypothetical protein [Bradyrhizobium sp. SRL28]MBT1509380.1 hypothetical protein [Bradyrhizobium sp. SRL28]
MPLMTPAELEPLQEVRRAAEEHLTTIRDLYYTRLNTPTEKNNDEDEANRLSKIADVAGALQTIYDAVSELEFEEEQPEEPAEPEIDDPRNHEEDEPEDDEDQDDDEDEEEDED